MMHASYRAYRSSYASPMVPNPPFVPPLGSSSTRRAHPTGIGGDPGRSEKVPNSVKFGQIRGLDPEMPVLAESGSFFRNSTIFDPSRGVRNRPKFGQKNTKIRGISRNSGNSRKVPKFGRFLTPPKTTPRSHQNGGGPDSPRTFAWYFGHSGR